MKNRHPDNRNSKRRKRIKYFKRKINISKNNENNFPRTIDKSQDLRVQELNKV